MYQQQLSNFSKSSHLSHNYAIQKATATYECLNSTAGQYVETPH